MLNHIKTSTTMDHGKLSVPERKFHALKSPNFLVEKQLWALNITNKLCLIRQSLKMKTVVCILIRIIIH